MRYRSRDNSTLTNTTFDYGSYLDTTENSDMGFTRMENMSDIVTPRFAEKSANGTIIISPLEVNKTIDSGSPGEVDVVYGSDYYGIRGTFPTQFYGIDLPNYGGNSLISSGVVAQTQDAALATAHAEANDATALGLVTLAEMNKTVSTVGYYLEDAFKILREVQKMRRNPTGYAKHLRTLAKRRGKRTGLDTLTLLQEQWLRYRYGLRAAIYELDNVKRSFYEEKSLRTVSRGYSERAVALSSSYDNTYYYGFHWDGTRDASYMVTASAGIYLDARSSTAMPLYQKLGLTELLPTVWELVPFSFVVDWFTNVGDLLVQFQPKNLKVLGSYLTTKVVVTEVTELSLRTHWVPPSKDGIPLVTNSCTPAVHRRETTNIERTPTASYAAIPSLDINLDVAKIADLVALLGKLLS